MKLSLSRKLLYTALTSPIAYVTIRAYKWQKRRKLEKIEEIKQREELLELEPVKLDREFAKNISSKDDAELDKIQFFPVILTGHFRKDGRNVLVSRTRSGQPGFHVVSPFYCYTDESGKEMPILIDRGWIPVDFKLKNLKVKLNDTINGIIYIGDKMNVANRVSETDIKKGNIFINMHPDFISKHLNLENGEVSSKFLVKETTDVKSQYQTYPWPIKKHGLLVWTITPQKHQDYANFWITATFLNVCSNLIVWVLL